jgi:hypothetical protein
MSEVFRCPLRRDGVYPERRAGHDSGLDFYWDRAAFRIDMLRRRIEGHRAIARLRERSLPEASDSLLVEQFRRACALAMGACRADIAAVDAVRAVAALAIRHGWSEEAATQAPRAALVMLAGGCAEVPQVESRALALAIAAAVTAGRGRQSHLVLRQSSALESAIQRSEGLFSSLGITANAALPNQGVRRRRDTYRAQVVYAVYAGIGADYLRDRSLRRGIDAEGRWRVDRLRGARARGRTFVLTGLDVAFADDATQALCEGGAAMFGVRRHGEPLAEVHRATEALGLAGQLIANEDFRGDRLTGEGRGRLRLLSVTLGPQWSAAALREALVEDALRALAMQPGVDFSVDVDGEIKMSRRFQMMFSGPNGFASESWARALAGREAPLALDGALPMQEIFRRYVHLGAVSPFARAYADELAEIYGLWLEPVTANARGPIEHRLAQDEEDRSVALLEAVRGACAESQTLVIVALGSDSATSLWQKLKTQDIPAALDERPDKVTGQRAALERGEILVSTEADPRLADLAAESAGRVYVTGPEQLGPDAMEALFRLTGRAPVIAFWTLDHQFLSDPKGERNPLLTSELANPAPEIERALRHAASARRQIRANIVRSERRTARSLGFAGEAE